jgi:hypothetical protein
MCAVRCPDCSRGPGAWCERPSQGSICLSQGLLESWTRVVKLFNSCIASRLLGGRVSRRFFLCLCSSRVGLSEILIDIRLRLPRRRLGIVEVDLCLNVFRDLLIEARLGSLNRRISSRDAGLRRGSGCQNNLRRHYGSCQLLDGEEAHHGALIPALHSRDFHFRYRSRGEAFTGAAHEIAQKLNGLGT